jgi:electron transfer flavoprotein beta subunit
LNILVCIKQVPNTLEIKINPKTNNLDREGIPCVMNPYDKNALEEAIRIKEKHGGKITVISMGPPQTEEVLREALAMCADEAVLLTDRAFAGADTLATTYVLAHAVKKLGDDFDIIFCGKEAIDADTGQVGPGLAERLGIAQITFVEKLEVMDNRVRANRKIEDGYEIVEADFPVLLTVTEKLNEPRYPKPINIMKAARKHITLWSTQDLGVSKEQVGQAGSPTVVGRLFTPEPKGKAEMFKGEPEEMCEKLIAKLKSEKVI